MYYNVRIWVETKLHIWVNGAGVLTSFAAWATDNIPLLINLLFFSIPMAIYSAFKFQQKYQHQARLNAKEIEAKEIEIQAKKQDLEHDKKQFEHDLNEDHN